MTEQRPKKRTQTNPNSLSNLKPIQKGEVRNPLGAGATPFKKEFQKFTAAVLSEMIEIALQGNLADLKKIVDDPDSPAIKVGIAKVIYDGIKAGDWHKIEQLLARSIGKVTDKIDHTTDGKPIDNSLRINFVRAKYDPPKTD